MDSLKPYLLQADARLSEYPVLVKFEKQTKVPKVYVAALLYVVYSVSIFFEIGAGVTTNVFALAYPIYAALNASVNEGLDQLKLWALYLGLFGIWSTVELTIGIWGPYVPFYYVIKTLVLGWLFVPHYNGIAKVADIVRPHVQLMFKQKKQE
ncbi:hypothetical protein EDD86DRAFT_187994 [Gorgonomyces haynaldii]|nr:hypothetical protein EDD86DRAFT_187994 [Gorgonomyces haynaldii]